YQGIGGLIEFELTRGDEPRQVAFVDQRIELIPGSVWEDYFRIEGAHHERWDELVEAYEIGTFLILMEDQQQLVQRLEIDPRWTRVAMDEAFVLFFDSRAEEALIRWRREPSGRGTAP
ncbi:MAG: hypothetical protein ACNA8W_22650, partial [Bradymonadaceae bacterium]